jgi:biopolymer transport protein ExbD
MSLAGRKRRQSLRLICGINVTAFLSIQVALLSIFLPIFPDRNMGRLSTDLAKVNHPVQIRGSDREDAMVISVMRTVTSILWLTEFLRTSWISRSASS